MRSRTAKCLFFVGIGPDQVCPEIAADKGRADALAFVQAVQAIAIRIFPVAGHAIGGDADGFQEYAGAVPALL